jgi:hypothetical protein
MSNGNGESAKRTTGISIQVPENKADGVYADLAYFTLIENENEVVMDFLMRQPPKGEIARLVSRVITSKNHALRIAETLLNLLKGGKR